jgi:hypothetical protein
MWTAVIAVLGTLAGGLANALAQARSERAARREAHAARMQERAATHQDSQVAAVESLVKSLNDHRAAMARRMERVLGGAPDDEIEALRDLTRATRSEISVPLASVSVRAPALAEVAETAARASYALRNVGDQAELDAARVAAGEAVTALIQAAARYFRWPEPEIAMLAS